MTELLDDDAASVVRSMLTWRDLVIAGDLRGLQEKHRRGETDETTAKVAFDCIDYGRAEILEWCFDEGIGNRWDDATLPDRAAANGDWKTFYWLAGRGEEVTCRSVKAAILSPAPLQVEEIIARCCDSIDEMLLAAVERGDDEFFEALYYYHPEQEMIGRECLWAVSARIDEYPYNPATDGHVDIEIFLESRLH